MTEKTPEELIDAVVTEHVEEYGTFQGVWTIQYLGRELGFSLAETNTIAALVFDSCPLIDSLKMSPQLQDLMRSDPRVKLMMDLALRADEKVSHILEKGDT